VPDNMTLQMPDPGALPRALDPASVRFYVRPLGIHWGPPPLGVDAVPFAGGRAWFAWAELAVRSSHGVHRYRAPVAALQPWARTLGAWAADRIESFFASYRVALEPFAGLVLDRPRLMGVINVTPDSFSDGGEALSAEVALARARAMSAAGADILDIGGESTRPGAAPVMEAEELSRVLPVVAPLAAEGRLVSIDTRNAGVMGAATAAGARIVNDVSAATHDPAAPGAIAQSGAAVVMMHTSGDPRTMQNDPRYEDVVLDVFDYLEARIAAMLAAGVPRRLILIDPGIGFGKTIEHNRCILSAIALYKGLGVGVLLGVSRKSFIGRTAGIANPKDRLPGSLALLLHGFDQGVDVVRVHDVAESVQALALWRSVRNDS
jgi:dihydropteroate synthase